MKDKAKLGLLVAAAILATTVGTSAIYAQTGEGGSNTFVQQLAQKLGVSEDKVQTAVNEIHTDRHAQMEKAYEDRLTTAVSNGELTEQQKQLLLQKHKELEDQRASQIESLKNKTPEERRTAMEQKRTELETWAKQNNIDLKWLMFGGKGGHHRGMMGEGFGPRGMMPGANATPQN